MTKNPILWTTLAASLVAVGVAPQTAVAQDAEVEELPTAEEDRELFWAEQSGVRVLMGGASSRRTVGSTCRSTFGAIPNDPFRQYYPIGLRMGYHLSESVGLRALGELLDSGADRPR